MKKTIFVILAWLIAFLTGFSAFAQDTERIELDASAYSAGSPFHFTVTVDSDEQVPFADVQARLTAVLCPVGQPADKCRIMNVTSDGRDDTSLKTVFTVDELPESGDYTLDISFLDVTGSFETETAAFLLSGVRPAEEAQAAAAGETAETSPEPQEAAETAIPEEAPVSVEASDGLTPEQTPEVQQADEVLPEETGPAEVKKVTLRPQFLDASGSPLIYGSTVYVGESYTLQLSADSAMNDSVVLEAALPASLQNAPLAADSGCFSYLNAEGTALRLPGSLWNAENGNAFSCELHYDNNIWMAANPVVFSLTPASETAAGYAETYEMDPVNWTNYPVNVTRFTASHQVQISDSRGNLLCSDMVPCAVFNAEDVYVFTYKFPADWGGSLPSGKDLDAEISWPAAWASGLSGDLALASSFGSPCSPDADGKTRLMLEETAPGRYSASCTFVPSGISSPVQASAQVHLNDNAYAVNDLSVWMPGTIRKSQAVLSPSLTLRMTEDSAPAEQIRSGTIGSLYRTPDDHPNLSGGYGMPAAYTLRAVIDGVSSARAPQYGDNVTVTWSLLDRLAQMGELPSCLVPNGNSYILGDLSQLEDGSWEASCDFRFPQTLDTNVPGGALIMQLNSGVYQTSARAEMSGYPFKQEKLYVDLDVPSHMLLKQPTEFHVRLSDSSGGFSDYLRAVLNYTGVSLFSDWVYNYTTTCQGSYLITDAGDASCSAFFDQPTNGESLMRFTLVTPAADRLFEAEFRPGTDINILPITPVKAELSVKLFHAGTEMSLPAYSEDAFVVSDDYQLQFTLTPDPEFRDVVNAVSVDGEGMVLDWWEPLLIRWGMIPNGETGLNFYRDGDHFIARYDFSFQEGNLYLEGNLSRLVMEAAIEGWDITLQNGWEPVQLPSRINRKPLSLSISEFTVPGSTETVGDLHVNEEASFDISFSGSLDHFDLTQLIVGYDSNGIRTPLSCYPDYGTESLRCTITAQCTDYNTSGTYNTICGTNLSLYAVYNGDGVNQAAEAASRTFNIKRNELYMHPLSTDSLGHEDTVSVQAATADMQAMDYGSLTIGGWNVDSFLPRRILDMDGQIYRSYPVRFSYEPLSGVQLEDNRLRLEVTFATGTGSMPSEEKISLRPRMVTDDEIYFELDFGAFDLLDDGRTIREALENAVTIKSLRAVYDGSPLVGSASALYEAEDLTFELKVADLLSMDVDTSMPGIMNFTGAASSEIMMQPFTVYCSQLFEPLNCSSEPPLDVLDENGVPILSDNDGDGCWGKIRTGAGLTHVFIDQGFAPQCYLTAWNNDRQIWIAMNGF